MLLTPKLNSYANGLLSDPLTLVCTANAELSGSALKVLLAVVQFGETTTISLADFMQATGLSKHPVIGGIRECLDWGWLLRTQVCPRCETVLPESDGKKVVVCPSCKKQVPPLARYAVQNPHSIVQKIDIPVHITHREHNGAEEVREATPVQNLHSAVSKEHRIATREDSESLESNDSGIDSESRLTAATETGLTYKPLEAWRRTSEDLARHSCQEIGDGTGSLGYHIAVWNHARKCDKQRGGKQTLTDGIFVILSELAERRRKSGQHQGKAWTRRTQKWFEDNGIPLPVKVDEAEQQEVRAVLANAPFMQKQG